MSVCIKTKLYNSHCLINANFSARNAQRITKYTRFKDNFTFI